MPYQHHMLTSRQVGAHLHQCSLLDLISVCLKSQADEPFVIAGCSSNDIGAACRALASAASSPMEVLKLGPPIDAGVSSVAGSQGGGGWEQSALDCLGALVQRLPGLKAVELWGMDESQLTQVCEIWEGSRGVAVHRSELASLGTRLDMQSRYALCSTWYCWLRK